MSELGINATSPVDLLTKAKEIVCRHKDLQAKASKLQGQVGSLEQDQKNLVLQRQQEITEKYAKQDPSREISSRLAEECILREISSTLSHRKKLHNQVSMLEGEVMSLEKTSEERKQAAAAVAAARQQQASGKTIRKSRDYRARSQDWPESSTKRPKINSTSSNQKPQETPKIANFEERLKSIIKSVLNEDQNNRNKNQKSSSNTQVLQNSSSYNVNTAYTYQAQNNSKEEDKKYSKYARCETIVRPDDLNRNITHQQEGLASMMESYRDKDASRSTQSIRQITPEQPDYRQVSPAKLALRRHLSQEKLAAQHHFSQSDGIVATRTIGDLVSGEIERTLEISNQCIINAAVDMSDIQGTTTLSSRSVVNSNMPPRPERVNVKGPNTEIVIPSKDTEPVIRQVYSPISRPSSAEGLEGLAFMHPHGKVVNHSINPYIVPPPPSPRQSQYSPRTTILYPTHSRTSSVGSSFSQNEHYTPLPRADIKPYHESYFNDVKPIMTVENENRNNFVPEGLAASLQARVLNSPHIKEEVDIYDRRTYIHNSSMPNMPLYQEQTGSIKTEALLNDCQYKRDSPIIQGPIRNVLNRSTATYMAKPQGSAFEENASPEPHSNTSTPLVDEVQESQRTTKPQDEGKCSLISLFI